MVSWGLRHPQVLPESRWKEPAVLRAEGGSEALAVQPACRENPFILMVEVSGGCFRFWAVQMTPGEARIREPLAGKLSSAPASGSCHSELVVARLFQLLAAILGAGPE